MTNTKPRLKRKSLSGGTGEDASIEGQYRVVGQNKVSNREHNGKVYWDKQVNKYRQERCGDYLTFKVLSSLKRGFVGL